MLGILLKWPLGRWTSAILCVPIVSLCLLQPAAGQRATPLIVDLDSSGAGASGTVRVDNTTASAITVEAAMRTFTGSANGGAPADDAFVIFPPTALVQSGQSQTFRLQYVGDPAIPQSELYFLSLEQLAVDLGGQDTTAVGFVVNFDVFVSVNPPGSVAQLEARSVAPDPQTGNWLVNVENVGARYTFSSSGRWTVNGPAGQAVALSGPALSQHLPEGRQVIGPRTSTTLQMVPVAGMTPSQVSIQIE